MKINKDDKITATTAEFMIIDKIRKDQRAEFVKDLGKLIGRPAHDFAWVNNIKIKELITKYQK